MALQNLVGELAFVVNATQETKFIAGPTAYNRGTAVNTQNRSNASRPRQMAQVIQHPAQARHTQSNPEKVIPFESDANKKVGTTDGF